MSHLHEIARELVAADTVSHKSCVQAMGRLADRLEAAGFCTALQRYDRGSVVQANLVAVAGPPEPDGLILSGHVDVVPFADQPGWTCDPLDLSIGERRVSGRGTSDMKVFLAQCVDVASRIDVPSLSRPLVMLFTAEEEIGCLGGARLAEGLGELLGDCPAPMLAWIGEPSSGRVFHAHKGIVAFQVEVRGQGGHSSVPEAGVNAIAVAARALEAIGSLQAEARSCPSDAFRQLYPDAPYCTVNFGTIQGGTAANMIAEACAFGVSYRPLPDEEPLAFYLRVRERLAEADLADWGSPQRVAEVHVGEPMVAPGLLSARGTSLERALFETYHQSESGGASFCTDGGQFARLGINSLICGPGELEQAHQPDESLSRRAFESGSDEILGVVLKLCGGRLRA